MSRGSKRGGKAEVKADVKPVSGKGLRSRTWKRFLRGPDPELLDQLYVPALREALRYDRCCAYFSSSVLAAAARGFAGLIERLITMGKKAPRPAVRLIVNEELSAEDVRALTERNDFSALERALKKRFKKPEDVLTRQRLQMLGWLAKERLLEVRVGVMRQGCGILHSKFGIVTDPAGDAVVFSGSGNESAPALIANYEQLEVSTSWEDKARYKEYSEQFEALWADRHSDVHTVTLPEALRLQLIKFAPKEPPVLEPSDALERQRAAMRWKFIVEAPYLPNGEVACDATAMVELWPHQRKVVEEVSKAWPEGRLLCDEVGLGKTIEAIFILRRLMAGRGVSRALLLLPAGLMKQWQAELREKGGMVCPRFETPRRLIWPDGSEKKIEGLADALRQDLLIMSRETARTEENRAIILEAEAWDLVLLDEAHAARRRNQVEGEFNSGTLLLDLLRQLQLRRKAKGFMFLSATPMQTHPWEPWDLLSVLGVGGAWLTEFGVIRNYYGAIGALTDGQCDIRRAERAASLMAADSDFPAFPGETSPPRDASSTSRRIAFSPSAQRGQVVTWLRKGSPLSRRMHRNTRDTLRQYYRMGLLDSEPPVRQIVDHRLDYQDASERRVYESITSYIDRRFSLLEKGKSGKGLVMTIYRRRAASSPFALKQSLERRQTGLLRVEQRHAYDRTLAEDDVPEALDLDELPEEEGTDKVSAAYPDRPEEAREERLELESVLRGLSELGVMDSKRDRFFDILRELTDDGRSVLVFTGYKDTMDYLRDALVSYYGKSVGCYSGAGGEIWDGEGWKNVTKDHITRSLKDGVLRVLVCTDAASEGLNLQAAGAVINYDLPWNPGRVEQRIGRIDRIGQRYAAVHVANLFIKDSVDDKVYSALRERCGLFEHFVGEMQPVLELARRMLMGREAVDLDGLRLAAKEAARDPLPKETYLISEAVQPSQPEVMLTVPEIAKAFVDGEHAGIRIRRTKDGVIEITGLERRKVRLAANTELLERFQDAEPMSLFNASLNAIAQRLSRAGERLPLVVESVHEDSFRASAAYWVGGGKLVNIEKMCHLERLLETWDGQYADAEAWHCARDTARRAARKRVQEMRDVCAGREKESLDRQLQAARLRLQRELGRYLICLGATGGDLNPVFHEQMSSGMARAERLKQCWERLGCYPDWSVELCNELEQFGAALTPGQREARLLGKELDAALHDPRWEAGSDE